MVRKVIPVFVGMVGVIMLFHITILIGIVPYTITWGGRLKTDAEMYLFETVSLLINFMLMYTLLACGGYFGICIRAGVLRVLLWIYLILFLLNTAGNIIAKTRFEQFFALVTLLFSVFIWMILRDKNLPAKKQVVMNKVNLR